MSKRSEEFRWLYEWLEEALDLLEFAETYIDTYGPGPNERETWFEEYRNLARRFHERG